VAAVHDDYQRVDPGPPYPSVVFHVCRTGHTMGDPNTIPLYTVKYGGVSFNLAGVTSYSETYFKVVLISNLNSIRFFLFSPICHM
jgi:hypothetical protein